MGVEINIKSAGTEDTVIWWWCNECQVTHQTPWCPYPDYNEAWQNMDDSHDNYRAYEICPHCRQLIESED